MGAASLPWVVVLELVLAVWIRANPPPGPQGNAPGWLKRTVPITPKAIITPWAPWCVGAGIGAGAGEGLTHPPDPSNAPWVAKTACPLSSQGLITPWASPWVVVLELVLAPDKG